MIGFMYLRYAYIPTLKEYWDYMVDFNQSMDKDKNLNGFFDLEFLN